MLAESLARAKRRAVDSAAFNDIARVATLGVGTGVGLRGLYGLLQTLGRASSEPPASIPAPVTLDVPVAKKKDETKRRAGMKFSQAKQSFSVSDYLPSLPKVTGLAERGLQNAGKFLTDTAKRVGSGVGAAARGDNADSPVGRGYYIPAMIAAGIGSGAAGYKLTDWLLDDLRKGEVEDELEQAKKEYEDALYGKTAEAVDEVHDAVVAVQEKQSTPTLGDVPGATTGAYLTYAIGAPLLVGKMVYDQEKKQQRKKLIDAAQNMRRRMRQESSPPPVYINPVMVGDEGKQAAAGAKSKKKKKPAAKPDSSAWLGYGLGGAGLGALGTAYGLASDKEVSQLNDAISQLDTNAFGNNSAVVPGETGLSHYAGTLAPAAGLSPMGIPAHEYILKVRGNKKLMDSIGLSSYWLGDHNGLQGAGGRAHYNAFRQGSIPGFAHMLYRRGEFNQPVPPEFSDGKTDIPYNTWLMKKLQDFVSKEYASQHAPAKDVVLNPFEVNPNLSSYANQRATLKKFFESMTPEEQRLRLDREKLQPEHVAQTNNYLGPAKKLLSLRSGLKDVGVTSLGAGAGALGGNWLYNKLRGKRRRSEVKQLLASGAGAGLGGLAAYFGGTDSGRAAVRGGLSNIRDTVRKLVAPTETQDIGAAPEIKTADWTDVSDRLAQGSESLKAPTTNVGTSGIGGKVREMWDSLSGNTKSEILWTLLAGAGGAAAGAIYSPRHSPIRGAIMGGTAGLGAGAGLAASNRFMDAPVARKLEGTLYGQAPVVLGATGLGVAAGLRAGRTLADLVGAKGRKEKGDEDLAEVDVLSNPELRDRVLA
jgi:hypothetical protein